MTFHMLLTFLKQGHGRRGSRPDTPVPADVNDKEDDVNSNVCEK